MTADLTSECDAKCPETFDHIMYVDLLKQCKLDMFVNGRLVR